MQAKPIAELFMYPECFPAQIGDIQKKAQEGNFGHRLSGAQIAEYTARKDWEISDVPEIPALRPRATVVWDGTGDPEQALEAITAHRQSLCSACQFLAGKLCTGMSTNAIQGENAVIALQSMTLPGGEKN